MADEEARKKQANLDAKRAEVRKRLEDENAKKSKKGFMTPERKKKLRLLLRKKAAEELKKEQERKSAARRRIIDERCGKPKALDGANDASIRAICKEYHERLFLCESQKWDLEYEVRRRDYEINELNIQVNDLRGKFIKPTLKKVSKYENKFAKLQKKAAEFNFRNQLKTVKKKEFELEDDKSKEGKPDWAAGGPGAGKKEGEEGYELEEGEQLEGNEDAAPPSEDNAPTEDAPADEVPSETAPTEESQSTENGEAPTPAADETASSEIPPADAPSDSTAEVVAPVEGAPSESEAPAAPTESAEVAGEVAAA